MGSLLHGVIAALWSPTNKHGELMEDVLSENLRFLRNQGIRALMALGSTGEFLYVDVEFRKRFVAKTIELAESLPVIVNVSDIRLEVVAEVGQSARVAGAAAIALLPPYFYPFNQHDIREFFVRAAEAVQLPLFLYNFPERTGNRIELETIAAVAERVPVAGVKQSGADFGYLAPLIKLGREKDFDVFTATEARLSEAMDLGAVGCVSGLANAVPDLVLRLYQAAWGAEREVQIEVAGRLQGLSETVDPLTMPLNVAAAMQGRGLQVGSFKPVLAESTLTRYSKIVDQVRDLFSDWKLI